MSAQNYKMATEIRKCMAINYNHAFSHLYFEPWCVYTTHVITSETHPHLRIRSAHLTGVGGVNTRRGDGLHVGLKVGAPGQGVHCIHGGLQGAKINREGLINYRLQVINCYGGSGL